MSRLLISFLSIIISFSAFSQSAEGRYASRMTPDGTIIFIMPQKLGKTEGIKNFEFDMTLLSWTDSVTVNFTYQSPTMGLPQSLTLSNSKLNVECTDYSLLYMDILKKGYEIRVTSKFSASDIKTLFSEINPPVFNFIQEGKPCFATYKEGAWKKDRKRINDIYQLYYYAK